MGAHASTSRVPFAHAARHHSNSNTNNTHSDNSASAFSEAEIVILKAAFKELAFRSCTPFSSKHQGGGSNNDIHHGNNKKHIDKSTFLRFFPLPGMHGEQLFALFDQRGTGFIGLGEFMRGLEIWYHGTFDEKVLFLFNLYDLNLDNSVSRAELQTMLMQLPTLALRRLTGHLDHEAKQRIRDSVIEMWEEDDDYLHLQNHHNYQPGQSSADSVDGITDTAVDAAAVVVTSHTADASAGGDINTFADVATTSTDAGATTSTIAAVDTDGGTDVVLRTGDDGVVAGGSTSTGVGADSCTSGAATDAVVGGDSESDSDSMAHRNGSIHSEITDDFNLLNSAHDMSSREQQEQEQLDINNNNNDLDERIKLDATDDDNNNNNNNNNSNNNCERNKDNNNNNNSNNTCNSSINSNNNNNNIINNSDISSNSSQGSSTPPPPPLDDLICDRDWTNAVSLLVVDEISHKLFGDASDGTRSRKDGLTYDMFKDWVREAPELLGFLQSVLPSISLHPGTPHHPMSTANVLHPNGSLANNPSGSGYDSTSNQMSRGCDNPAAVTSKRTKLLRSASSVSVPRLFHSANRRGTAQTSHTQHDHSHHHTNGTLGPGLGPALEGDSHAYSSPASSALSSHALLHPRPFARPWSSGSIASAPADSNPNSRLTINSNTLPVRAKTPPPHMAGVYLTAPVPLERSRTTESEVGQRRTAELRVGMDSRRQPIESVYVPSRASSVSSGGGGGGNIYRDGSSGVGGVDMDFYCCGESGSEHEELFSLDEHCKSQHTEEPNSKKHCEVHDDEYTDSVNIITIQHLQRQSKASSGCVAAALGLPESATKLKLAAVSETGQHLSTTTSNEEIQELIEQSHSMPPPYTFDGSAVRPIVSPVVTDLRTTTGTLHKIGRRFHHFVSRWFVLHDNEPFLYYYHNQKDVQPAGVVMLENCSVEAIDPPGDNRDSLKAGTDKGRNDKGRTDTPGNVIHSHSAHETGSSKPHHHLQLPQLHAHTRIQAVIRSLSPVFGGLGVSTTTPPPQPPRLASHPQSSELITTKNIDCNSSSDEGEQIAAPVTTRARRRSSFHRKRPSPSSSPSPCASPNPSRTNSKSISKRTSTTTSTSKPSSTSTASSKPTSTSTSNPAYASASTPASISTINFKPTSTSTSTSKPNSTSTLSSKLTATSTPSSKSASPSAVGRAVRALSTSASHRSRSVDTYNVRTSSTADITAPTTTTTTPMTSGKPVYGLRIKSLVGEGEPRQLFTRSREDRDRWLKAIAATTHARRFEDFYQQGRQIGTGRFSVVHSCRRLDISPKPQEPEEYASNRSSDGESCAQGDHTREGDDKSEDDADTTAGSGQEEEDDSKGGCKDMVTLSHTPKSLAGFRDAVIVPTEESIVDVNKKNRLVLANDGPDFTFAVKVINKSEIKPGDKELVRNELAVLRLVNQNNVVRTIDMFESPTQILIVMQRIQGGELFDRIVGRACLTELEAHHVIKALVTGIKYLHALGVAHRDIKPENLLVGTNLWDIKITDFGLSKLTTPDQVMVLPCGTLSYAAPEVLTSNPYLPSGSTSKSNTPTSSTSKSQRSVSVKKESKNESNKRDTSGGGNNSLTKNSKKASKGTGTLERTGYGKEADLWSVGVVLYLLIAGRLPFSGRTQRGTAELICGLELRWDIPPFSRRSAQLRSLLAGLLCKDPKRRLTATQVLEHPWIKLHDPKALEAKRAAHANARKTADTKSTSTARAGATAGS